MIKFNFLSSDELKDVEAGVTSKAVAATCKAVTKWSGKKNQRFSGAPCGLVRAHAALRVKFCGGHRR